jgi:hypothetical protein
MARTTETGHYRLEIQIRSAADLFGVSVAFSQKDLPQIIGNMPNEGSAHLVRKARWQSLRNRNAVFHRAKLPSPKERVDLVGEIVTLNGGKDL